eukprot:751257-Hanusia_phi.AAC.4
MLQGNEKNLEVCVKGVAIILQEQRVVAVGCCEIEATQHDRWFASSVTLPGRSAPGRRDTAKTAQGNKLNSAAYTPSQQQAIVAW